MDYWHKNWVCPFFQWDGINEVHCECGSKIIFPGKEEAQEFMEKHCANIDNWNRCSIAKILNTYYDKRKDKTNEKELYISKTKAEGEQLRLSEAIGS